ncbi:MAG: hypothetical protein LBF04_07330, partial [Prevotellaceae bacterium]|nr:hypothetical protein [Prevotellaceae bacterium]
MKRNSESAYQTVSSIEKIRKLEIHGKKSETEYTFFNFKQYNKSMSVSGNTDLQIEFTDGKKLLTGRHKHEKKTEILRKFD